MILEFQKSFQAAIERAIKNSNSLRNKYAGALPKIAQQKLGSIINDLELLRDSLGLFSTKVQRLQSKCSLKEGLAEKSEFKYKQMFDQSREVHTQLQKKCEKMTQELNFIKFSNKCLRKQIQNYEIKSNNFHNTNFFEIQQILQNNNDSQQQKLINIHKIIQNHKKQQQQENLAQKNNQFDRNCFTARSSTANKNEEKRECSKKSQVDSIEQYMLEKDQKESKNQFPKDFKGNFDSLQLKLDSENLKTRRKNLNRKEGFDNQEFVSTEKKKRSQLAHLVEQQSRLARINERYLSTDLP